MKIRLSILALALVSACATTEAPPPADVPATLSDEAFRALLSPIQASQDTFKKHTLIKADQDLTALLARDDLTDDQRGEVYYARGFSRGLYVRDFPRAFPQCAVLDYREMEKLSPNNRMAERMNENRAYQFYRAHYFTDAPADCVEEAAVYRAELAAAGAKLTWP